MDSRTEQPHYAPASVGVLVDPEFLRDAVLDANGGRRAAVETRFDLRLRCRQAIDAIKVSLQRR
jgi:hypothetical protein